MLFAVIILKESKALLVVPTKNCKVFHDKTNAYFLNNGIIQYQETEVFNTEAAAAAGKKPKFSKGDNKVAEFCYVGFVMKVFGKKKNVSHALRLRSIAFSNCTFLVGFFFAHNIMCTTVQATRYTSTVPVHTVQVQYVSTVRQYSTVHMQAAQHSTYHIIICHMMR